MCTVTFLPLGNNDFILTSNRDESPLRDTLAPQKYQGVFSALYYPKDAVAGGTWIATSENKRMVCLLNGAFLKHKHQPPYRKSRGKISLEVLEFDDLEKDMEAYDLTKVEPFTLTIVDWEANLSLYELVWDGVKKHFQKLPLEPRIWSSATLYTPEIQALRREWFADWLRKQEFTPENVTAFHQSAPGGVTDKTVFMKRPLVETVSTTCVCHTKEQTSMQYTTYSLAQTKKIQKQELVF